MLTLLPLHFTCEVLTPVLLPGYRAGSQLRGALGNVMRRAYCPEVHFGRGQSSLPSPDHVAVCPVCWLLAANEHPGEERRGYALTPPMDGQSAISPREQPYAPGERFHFGLTLFGDTVRLLPYFLLAVAEMGREGVGIGRGRFALRQVWAADALSGRRECVLAEGAGGLVRVPSLRVDADVVDTAAASLQGATALAAGRLALRFLTPMRLVADDQLVKAPDFGVLFARLLERIDQLDRQHCGGQRRDPAERLALQACADRVRLVEAQTRWVEVRSGSTRRGEPSWISGFVGEARYVAPADAWPALLPWLLWGQLTQVGKDAVKGNGVYRLTIAH